MGAWAPPGRDGLESWVCGRDGLESWVCGPRAAFFAAASAARKGLIGGPAAADRREIGFGWNPGCQMPGC
eukprot:COSAG01_NODE_2997_length_6741_cov_8.936917_8_plen_70_part_00